jgi:hypothetical protein
LSTKKGGGSSSGDEWDASEFDFTQIKSKQRTDDQKIFDEIKGEQPRAENERSLENEKYFEGVSTYIEQPTSQADSYIDQPTSQADSYKINTEPGKQMHDDAYNVNTSGQVVKHKKDCFEKAKVSVSAAVDSQYALDSLGQLVSSGAVVDRKVERISSERRANKSRRRAQKNLDSSAKSNMGSALVIAQTGDDDKGGEELDIISLFTGPNLKKSILASIILDKSKF